MVDRVAVVTDSTAYLPLGVAAQHGVTVVPVQVVIGGKAYDEDAITPSDVAEALRTWTPVTTSRPSPQAFHEAYEKLAASGVSGVVSVHLSAALSSTLESAQLAARDSSVPVDVVDSQSVGMGLGYPVISAAQVAASGGGLVEVARVAHERAAATREFFYVDTLEYLRRGGRIGAAAALVGSALSVKPLLHVVDGRVETLEKVRTATKALARLEDVAVAAAADADVDVAVHHLANPARAEELATRLGLRIPNLHDVVVSEVGAVVGAHVGPGMLAVVVAPR
jgi:DegV family protein with EDD domain